MCNMMGSKTPQTKLFCSFGLADRVPHDHLLRAIEHNVDFSLITDLTRPFYSHTGSPSVDPIVIFRMSLLGYLCGISSERKLTEECRLNMAFLWFLGYHVDEVPPDHSILSKSWQRYGR